MVTTILPSMTLQMQHSLSDSDDTAINGRFPHSYDTESSTRNRSSTTSSDLTITPARIGSSSASPVLTPSKEPNAKHSPDSSRVAGLVGVCAGCGALLALGAFLPLPARLERAGASPEEAWKHSYYIVAAVAVVIAIVCLFGFRNLQGEETKSPLVLFRGGRSSAEQGGFEHNIRPAWSRFSTAFALAFRNGDIGVGYVGGFVARASSVGLSLFIPLLVNAHFQSSGLCVEDALETPGGLPDLKRKCPKAYILAAQLSGVASLVGLIVAHPFGYFSSKSKRFHLPLVFSAVVGIIGYVMFPLTFAPEQTGGKGSAVDYVAVSLLGMSQIGAVVSSLAVLSSAVLKEYQQGRTIPSASSLEQNNSQPYASATEASALLTKTSSTPSDSQNLVHLKGAIAGMYSLFGGAGILLLTKLGGLLFDRLSFGAPFFVMAIFNAILFLLCMSRIGVVYFTARKKS
ncbi:MAG: hypothetical protein Q9160_007354 [Pyrenula sp. 1 TL-2023]